MRTKTTILKYAYHYKYGYFFSCTFTNSSYLFISLFIYVFQGLDWTLQIWFAFYTLVLHVGGFFHFWFLTLFWVRGRWGTPWSGLMETFEGSLMPHYVNHMHFTNCTTPVSVTLLSSASGLPSQKGRFKSEHSQQSDSRSLRRSGASKLWNVFEPLSSRSAWVGQKE